MSSAADASEIWLRHRGGEPAALDAASCSERIFSQFGSRGPSSCVDARRAARSRARSGPRRCARSARSWRLDGERLHVLAGDVPLLGDHLGAAELDDLLVAVARRPSPATRRTGRRSRAARATSHRRARSGSCSCSARRRRRRGRCVPAITRLGGEVHGLLRRAALAVDGGAGHVARAARPRASTVRAMSPACGPMRVDAAEDDVVDRGRVDAGALDQRA